MDDDNSRTLEFSEFYKAMKDLQLGFSDDEVKLLFAGFDIDRSGHISYDEFLRIIRVFFKILIEIGKNK